MPLVVCVQSFSLIVLTNTQISLSACKDDQGDLENVNDIKNGRSFTEACFPPWHRCSAS